MLLARVDFDDDDDDFPTGKNIIFFQFYLLKHNAFIISYLPNPLRSGRIWYKVNFLSGV